MAYLAPLSAGSAYMNYMGFNSIVLLAICDAHYRFIYVNVGSNGILGDASIWNQCEIRKALHDKTLDIPMPRKLPGSDIVAPYVLLADDAFALSSFLVKPYSHKGLSESEADFNYLLSRNRRLIECSFGIAASKFNLLKTVINIDADKAIKSILAICALHNWLRCEKIHSDNILDITDIEMSNLTSLNPYRGRTSREAEAVRSSFKNYINQQGIVNILNKCKEF